MQAHPLNQSPAAAQQSPGASSNPPKSVTQNSSTTTPPTITINGDNPAIIEVGDTYSDLGATVRDTGPGRAGDTNLGYQTYVNGTEMSPVETDTSPRPHLHLHPPSIAERNSLHQLRE
jgi:hypothetical protein